MASDVAEAVAAMILERGQARAGAAERRLKAKAAARAEHKAARQAGLAARHAQKSARARRTEMLF